MKLQKISWPIFFIVLPIACYTLLAYQFGRAEWYWLNLLLASILLLLGPAYFFLRLHQSRGEASNTDRAWNHSDSLRLLALGGLAVISLASYLASTPAPLEKLAQIPQTKWGVTPTNHQPKQKTRLLQRHSQDSGNWLFSDSRNRSLPREANYKPGSKPEVFLRPHGDSGRYLAQRLYLTAFVLEHYEQGNWNSGTDEKSYQADADGWVNLSGQAAPPPLHDDLSYTIYLNEKKPVSDARQKYPLIGICGLKEVYLPTVEKLGSWWQFTPQENSPQYQAISRPQNFDTISLQGKTQEEKAAHLQHEQKERLSQIPMNAFGSRLIKLTGEVQGNGNEIERLQNIQNYLRSNFHYSLKIRTPQQQDPLEHFLYNSRSGHCEFFAEAAALMARAAGFPSRIAYGWAGGTWYESGQLFVFRARDAHAWAEIYLPERGWVVFDTTPTHEGAISRSSLANPNEAAPKPDDFIANRNKKLLKMWPITGILTFLLLLGIFLRNRKQNSKYSANNKHRTRVSYRRQEPKYLRMLRARHLSMGGKQPPGKTIRCIARELAELQNQPDCWGELVNYYYGVRYSGIKRLKNKEIQFQNRLSNR